MRPRKRSGTGQATHATSAQEPQIEAVSVEDVPPSAVADEPPGTVRRSNVKIVAVVAAALLVLGALGLAFTQNAFGGPVTSAHPSLPVVQPYLGSTQGCDASYWASPEHFQAWEEYQPDQLVGSLFGHARNFADMSLAEALANPLSGEDVRRALIRQAVTAALNAANDALAFPYARYNDGVDKRPPLVATTNRLLTSGADADIAKFTADLSQANQLGCPL
jgi:hypothetical protein